MIPRHKDPVEAPEHRREPGGAIGELRKVLENDDGVWNVEWWTYTEYSRGECQYPLTRCAEKASYWCVHCGGLVCEKHRKNHSAAKWHDDRMMDLREPVTDE